MDDRLEKRYRNISGTILIINDLNYMEIGINEVVDLDLFSDDFLSKSKGLRDHIALNNLVPDASNVKAKQIDEDTFRIKETFNDSFIKELAAEVSKKLDEKSTDIDVIRMIAAEVGKEIANNMPPMTDLSLKQDIKQDNSEYEENIVNSSVDRMQEILSTKSPQKSSNVSSEENFDGNEDYVLDLKNLLGGKNEK